MFPTKETTDNQKPDQEPSFDSVDHFGQWIDAELVHLVDRFEEFKTNKSVRKFLSRS